MLVAEKLEDTGWGRSAAVASAQDKRDICVSIGGCTYDSIYNLEFASAWYACQVEGHACPQYTDSWYYVAAEMVNLSSASVSTVSTGAALANGDDSPYYSVRGDEKTWVSNGTVKWNMFDFQIPNNYSKKTPGCKTTPESSFDW